MRFVVLALLLLVAPAWGQSSEARRQLDLAWEDIAAGYHERAVASAKSAMRLDPLLYEAMVASAVGYEAMGDRERAKGLLVAYFELTSGLEPDPRAVAAKERLDKPPEPEAEPSADASSADAASSSDADAADAEPEPERELTAGQKRDRARIERLHAKDARIKEKARKKAEKAQKASKKKDDPWD